MSGDIRSCAACFTDYQIQITRKRGKWTVQITLWPKLGKCRSPHNLEWKNLLTRCSGDISIWRRETCAAGVFRKEWMQQDAVSRDEDIETTFVI
jgi:hypothetical protein